MGNSYMNTVLDIYCNPYNFCSGKTGTMKMGTEIEMEMGRKWKRDRNGNGNGDIIYRPYLDISGEYFAMSLTSARQLMHRCVATNER